MTVVTNAENLRQYKSMRSKKFVSKFQINCATMFYLIKHFHLDN